MKPSGDLFLERKQSRRLGVDVREASRKPRGREARPTPWARPHPRGQGVGPLWYFFRSVFFIISKNNLREVSGHSENFYSCTKITPWQFC